MIVRILGEGQFDIPGAHADELDLLDARLQSAGEAGDEAAFTAALQALRDAVRRHGAPVPLDALVASELVLPAEDTSLDQVRALLAGEGLIPG
ncbi:MAG: PspA-associated protein PspAA [Streptosporangiaceae bacterium]